MSKQNRSTVISNFRSSPVEGDHDPQRARDRVSGDQLVDTVLFGGKIYSSDEITDLVDTLLLAITSPGGVSDHAAMTTLHEVEGMFEDNPWSHIYALWHWRGGKAAQIADLTVIYNRLRFKEIDDIVYAISPDYNGHLEAIKTIRRAINKVVHGTSDPDVAASLLADVLDGLITTVSDYVGFDESTDTWSDPNGLLPLMSTWVVMSTCLRDGPDDQGHYLPDEMMYGVLVADAPQQV